MELIAEDLSPNGIKIMPVLRGLIIVVPYAREVFVDVRRAKKQFLSRDNIFKCIGNTCVISYTLV